MTKFEKSQDPQTIVEQTRAALERAPQNPELNTNWKWADAKWDSLRDKQGQDTAVIKILPSKVSNSSSKAANAHRDWFVLSRNKKTDLRNGVPKPGETRH